MQKHWKWAPLCHACHQYHMPRLSHQYVASGRAGRHVLLQADGLLGNMLAEQQWLVKVLLRLGGNDEGKHREPDDAVREALAEAILLLVRFSCFCKQASILAIIFYRAA